MNQVCGSTSKLLKRCSNITFSPDDIRTALKPVGPENICVALYHIFFAFLYSTSFMGKSSNYYLIILPTLNPICYLTSCNAL